MDMNGEQRSVMKGIQFQDWVVALIASEKNISTTQLGFLFGIPLRRLLLCRRGGVFQQGFVLLILQIRRHVLPASVLG